MSKVDMDKVCDILKERGIPAYVEQTGGGCATVYAGEPWDEEGWGKRYPALAGPGWFEGPGWTNARGDTDDFCIGLDDDGVGEFTMAEKVWDEARIADEVARYVKAAHESKEDVR